MKLKLKIIFLGIIFLSLPLFTYAAETFNIDPSYDWKGREEIQASLHQIGKKAYFYVEDIYYQQLNFSEKSLFEDSLKNLSSEFDGRIYPILTTKFGSEWKPGIDKDEKITILIHPMQKEAGGYFNNADQYPRAQVPTSNEREMVYLNANFITDPLAKSLLSHEFTHLITFNQKNRKYGVEEDIWLNEGRAEYAPTLIGYNTPYSESILKKRVDAFLANPSDSLTEWKNQKTDYGVLNLFIQYLVDYYGVKILVDSLHSEKTGIESINYVLKKNNFEEDFSQIFTNWTITVLVNNCSLAPKYCYLNENLKNFRIAPQTNFLPFAVKATLTRRDSTKDWSGNWYKIIGGKGELEIEFSSEAKINFKIPYLLGNFNGDSSINFLVLDSEGKGEIYIPNFGKNYTSLTLIPSVQGKISDFTSEERTFEFSWTASIAEETEAEIIERLLEQIAFLKTEITKIQAQIDAILARKAGQISCQEFEENLFYGLRNDNRVRCLQEFLKSQGSEIYPESLVTGNFLSLTQQAVIRFQEKYASEILAPLGLEKGTGYVGPATRAKINQLLK